MGLIANYQQGVFSTPVNGGDGDAAVVLSNDNAVRAKHNLHDADATIHVQTTALASRPVAGTAGRTWITTDGLRVYVDSGAAWGEIAYLGLVAGGTVTGATTFSNGVTVTAGGVTVTGNSAITGTLTVSSTINSQTISAAANFTGSVTVANGLTVSAGTTAVQALTATTGVFIGDTLTAGSNTATPVLLLNGADANSKTIRLSSVGVQKWAIYSTATNHDLQIDRAGGGGGLTIAQATGAATFIAGITATTGTFSGAVSGTSWTGTGQIKTTLTTQQLALHYDASNHLAVTVASDGAVTYNATGAGASHNFPDSVAITGTLTATGVGDFGSSVVVRSDAADYLTIAVAGGGATTFTNTADAGGGTGFFFNTVNGPVINWGLSGTYRGALTAVAGHAIVAALASNALALGSNGDSDRFIIAVAGTPANSSTGNIFIKSSTAPTGNPSGGGFLFVESGALKYRGSSGTVTTLGPA